MLLGLSCFLAEYRVGIFPYSIPYTAFLHRIFALFFFFFFTSNLRNYRLSPSSTFPATSRRILVVTFLWCQLLTIEERFRRNDCDETLMDVFGTEVRAKNEDRPFPRQRSLSTLSFARINLDGAELYYNDSMSRFRGRPRLSGLVIWVNDEHTTGVIASRPFDRALLRSLPVCESALAWRLHYGVNVSNRYTPSTLLRLIIERDERESVSLSLQGFLRVQREVGFQKGLSISVSDYEYTCNINHFS